jgi:hypothetical protein
MKLKKIAVAGIAIVASIAIVWLYSRQRESQSIARVLNERKNVRVWSRIDVSACPADFRQAWFQYASAHDDAVDDAKQVREHPIASTLRNNGAALRQANGEVTRMQMEWMSVSNCAAAYGVTFTPQ